MATRKTRIVVSITIIVIALISLTVGSFNENLQYFVTVKDVQAMSAEDLQKGLRIKGYLVPGSLEEEPSSLEVFFMLEEEGASMRVRFDKERPDTFKDGSEVLVEGKFTDAGYFDARTLMAKCPSKYETEGEYDVKDYDPSKYVNESQGTN